MARRAATVFVLVLFSALLNPAVGWLCMLHPPLPGVEFTVEAEACWIHWRDDSRTSRVTGYEALRFVGHDRIQIRALLDDPAAGHAVVTHLKVVRSGFPFRSLEAARWWGGVDSGLRRGIDIDAVNTEYGWVDLLPLQPIWPGFIANVAVYSALALAALYAPVWIARGMRRRARREQGRCPDCNYDLCGVDHASCPECGRPVE